MNGERHRIVSDNSQKIFPVGPMAVAAAGSAFIGSHTIAGTLDRFVAQTDKKNYRDFDRFLQTLGKFFHDSFNEYLRTSNQTWEVETHGYPIDLLVAATTTMGSVTSRSCSSLARESAIFTAAPPMVARCGGDRQTSSDAYSMESIGRSSERQENHSRTN